MRIVCTGPRSATPRRSILTIRQGLLRVLAASTWLCVSAPQAQVIALDTGHSIATQGAISARGVAEFEFNRALTLAVDEALRGAGYATTMIGTDGQTLDLASRPRKAAAAGAVFFLSLHHDSAKARFQRDWEFEGRQRKFLDDRFRGFSLFISRENPKWWQALPCASAIGAHLIAAGFKPSRYHADAILGSGREFADEANGVHFFDALAVLRRASMPAVLLEAGVIVNRDDESMLARPQTRQAIGRAVAAGLGTCLAPRH